MKKRYVKKNVTTFMYSDKATRSRCSTAWTKSENTQAFYYKAG